MASKEDFGDERASEREVLHATMQFLESYNQTNNDVQKMMGNERMGKMRDNLSNDGGKKDVAPIMANRIHEYTNQVLSSCMLPLAAGGKGELVPLWQTSNEGVQMYGVGQLKILHFIQSVLVHA